MTWATYVFGLHHHFQKINQYAFSAFFFADFFLSIKVENDCNLKHNNNCRFDISLTGYQSITRRCGCFSRSYLIFVLLTIIDLELQASDFNQE